MKIDDKYIFGYDIGITSVGWAVINKENNKLVDFGVRKFDEALSASSRRIKKSSRRTIKRKKWRKDQIKNAFVDFKILNREVIDSKNFMMYTAKHDTKSDAGKLGKDVDEMVLPTIYHVRKKGLTEKLTKRELFLAIYNIAKTRGHFLIEDVDFKKDTVKTADLYPMFLKLCEPHFLIANEDDFYYEIFLELVEEGLFQKELKARLEKNYIANVDEEEGKLQKDKLVAICNGLIKCKFNISLFEETESVKTIYATELKNNENNSDFSEQLVNLYDLIQVVRILKEYDYLCEMHVCNFEKLTNMYEKNKSKLYDKLIYTTKSGNKVQEMELENIINKCQSDIKEYEDYKKEIQKKMHKKSLKKHSERIRVIKNLANNFPNGLYLKEACKILKIQQKYYPEISDEFIQVVEEIIKARIPYYIGTLKKHENNNAWLKVNDNTKFKYSYNYTQEKFDKINESETIETWKNGMISRCTYLSEEYALPKNSIFTELFVILNDLNNVCYQIVEGNEKSQLDRNQKIQLINEVFLKEREVKFLDISQKYSYYYFGYKNSEKIKQFNKVFSVYFDIPEIFMKVIFSYNLVM